MEVKPDFRYRLAHRSPFFYGWVIVGAAFLGSFAGGGLQSFTFGVFIKPMSENLGWSRAALVGALTVRTYVSAALAPIFGTVVDRYGPRYLMTASAVVGGVAALMLTQVSEIWQFYAVFALIGLAGGTGAGALVVQATVVKWFVRLRGRAVAFSTMGNAAAGAVLAPFIGFIIATSGWENGWIVMSVLFLAFLLPVSFLMVRQPEDVGLLPDGAKSQEELDATYQSRAGRESAVSWRLKEALRTRALWLILLAQVVGGAPVSSVVLHEFSFVTDEGFNTAVAAAVLATHAVAASLARLLWGFLVERYHVRYCLAASSTGSAIGLIFLLGGLHLGINSCTIHLWRRLRHKRGRTGGADLSGDSQLLWAGLRRHHTRHANANNDDFRGAGTGGGGAGTRPDRDVFPGLYLHAGHVLSLGDDNLVCQAPHQSRRTFRGGRGCGLVFYIHVPLYQDIVALWTDVVRRL